MTSWETLKEFGLQPEKVHHLLWFDKNGVELRVHENEDLYLRRAEEKIPMLVPMVFEDKETALRIIRAEIDELHAVVHKIQIQKNLIHTFPMSGTMIAAIAITTGVKVPEGETGEAWSAHVTRTVPGGLNFLAATQTHRDAKVMTGMRLFHRDVLEARARVITALFFVIAPLMALCAFSAFGFPEHPAFDLQPFMRSMMLLATFMGAWMVLLTLRLRMIYARAEQNPKII